VAIDIGILWAFSATFWVFASREAPTGLSRFGGPCEGRGLCTNVNDRYVQGWPMVALTLVWVAYLVGVFVVQRGLTGRTVGTMLTGVVVVGDDGRPLGVGKGLLRSVAGVVDYLPCCLPIVGVVTILASPGHRRVGDMAADSYVVDDEWFGRPIEPPGLLPPPTTAPPPDRYPAQPPIPPAARPPVAPAAPAAPPASPAPPEPGPVWDPDRRAYLQWDPARAQWLQFDQATGEWQQYDPTTGRWRGVDR